MKNRQRRKKENTQKTIVELNEPSKDKSPVIPQREKIKYKLDISRRELTDKQNEFLELALSKESKLIFVSGPAGTSKTFMSILCALELMNSKKISDLIYIRSAVESSESKLGYLPGEADEKMAPYIQPLLDKLDEFLSKKDTELLMKEERVSSIPVGFLRGLNWNAKAIVVDEAQNLTYKELFTLITRIGEFSKVFILGDPKQSDINGKSGFIKMMNIFKDDDSKENGIHAFEFSEEDIVRSGLVRFIINKTKNIT